MARMSSYPCFAISPPDATKFQLHKGSLKPSNSNGSVPNGIKNLQPHGTLLHERFLIYRDCGHNKDLKGPLKYVLVAVSFNDTFVSLVTLDFVEVDLIFKSYSNLLRRLGS